MSLDKLINRPCTIHRTASSEARDALGNEVPQDSDVETVCELQSIDSSENPQGVSDTRWRIYFLPGEEIGSGDEVTVPDEGRFKVEGKPARKRNPRARRMEQIEAIACLVSAPDEEVGS